MHLTLLIYYFLFFSFCGWILDSTSCTISQRRLVNSGYFRELPLCPIYGIGGLVLVFLFNSFSGYPWVIPILIGTIAVNLVEYIGGVFCVTILKERLWDYSHRKWHLHGHIDALHAVCWFFVVILSYFYLFPWFLRLDTFLRQTLVIPPKLDVFTFAVFITGTIFLTFSRRHHRLRKLRKKK